MTTQAFQRIYTKLNQVTKATCSVQATNVGNEEMAIVDGRLAQVVKIMGDVVVLQIFTGTEGIGTDAEVVFLGKPPVIKVGEQLSGRFFNAFGDPIDGGPEVEGIEVEIGGIIIPKFIVNNAQYVGNLNVFCVGFIVALEIFVCFLILPEFVVRKAG